MKLSPEERKEKKREDNKRYRQNRTEEQKNKTITPLKQTPSSPVSKDH